MFDIYLTHKKVDEPDVKAVYGRICVGEYFETFTASLVFWSHEQYKKQWRTALRKIVDGESRSALITSFAEPKEGEFLFWWPLYREGEIVYVQNQILLFENLSVPFVIERPWDSVQERQIMNAEGRKVSEWAITVQDIKEWFERG